MAFMHFGQRANGRMAGTTKCPGEGALDADGTGGHVVVDAP